MTLDTRIANARMVWGNSMKVIPKTKSKIKLVNNIIDEKIVTRKEQYSQCIKKQRYASKSAASIAAKKCESKRGYPLRVYFCEMCGGWHITKKEKRKEKIQKISLNIKRKNKMEDINEVIEKMTTKFNAMRSQLEKITALVDDINKCESEYTKTLIVSTIKKLSESAGLKERMFD